MRRYTKKVDLLVTMNETYYEMLNKLTVFSKNKAIFKETCDGHDDNMLNVNRLIKNEVMDMAEMVD